MKEQQKYFVVMEQDERILREGGVQGKNVFVENKKAKIKKDLARCRRILAKQEEGSDIAIRFQVRAKELENELAEFSNFQIEEGGVEERLFRISEAKKGVLQRIKEYELQIKKLDNKIAAFERRVKSARSGENVVADFVTLHASFAKKFMRSRGLGRILLLSLLRKVVEVYDGTIKELLGSSSYKGDSGLRQKVKRFGKLLLPYLSLMEQWIWIVSDVDRRNIRRNEKYISDLRSVVKKIYNNLNEKSLDIGEGFDVTFLLVTRLEANVQQTKTLGELFTVIHQNLETTLAALNLLLGLGESALPRFLSWIMDEVKSAGEESELAKVSFQSLNRTFRGMDFVGVEYRYPTVEVFYNIPLSHHSAAIKLAYNAKEKDIVTLSFSTFGIDWKDRWDWISRYASLYAVESGCDFIEPPKVVSEDDRGGEGVSFSLQIHLRKSKWRFLAKHISYMLLMTFADDTPEVELSPKVFKNVEKDENKLIDIISRLPERTFTDSFFINEFFIEMLLKKKKYHKKALRLIDLIIEKLLKISDQRELLESESELAKFCTLVREKLLD